MVGPLGQSRLAYFERAEACFWVVWETTALDLMEREVPE